MIDAYNAQRASHPRRWAEVGRHLLRLCAVAAPAGGGQMHRTARHKPCTRHDGGVSGPPHRIRIGAMAWGSLDMGGVLFFGKMGGEYSFRNQSSNGTIRNQFVGHQSTLWKAGMRGSEVRADPEGRLHLVSPLSFLYCRGSCENKADKKQPLGS